MNCRTYIAFLALLTVGACTNYSECNEIMAKCSDSNAPFCLYGFDFKKEAQTTTISYSFHSAGNLVSTHAENDLTSQSFELLIPCAKEEIQKALQAYEGVGDLAFTELKENKPADIRFYVADMADKRAAVSFPNFVSGTCMAIAGNVIINSKISGYNCELFYSLTLHEIGHTLGLGHVSSDNIMNSEINLEFDALQAGDSLGIIALYGKKSRQ